MRGFTRVAIIVLAALMTLPAASATWMGMGSSEPGKQDNPNFMYDVATTSPGHIYFNHWADEGPIFGLFNPNVASVDSRQAPPGFTHHMAMLGQWVDCNQDGYIGIAESALMDYPSQLLTADQATTICPEGGDNNAQGWVTEFRPIGTNIVDPTVTARYNSQINPRMIADNESIVWGDSGLPNDGKDILSGSCQATPQQGSLHSTGQFLQFADCTTGVYQNYEQLFYGFDVGAFGQGPVPVPGIGGVVGFDNAGPNCYGEANCPGWTAKGPWNVQTAGPDAGPEGGKPDVVAQDCSSQQGALTPTTAPVTSFLAGAKPDPAQVPKDPSGTVDTQKDYSDQYDAIVASTELNRVKPLPSGGVQTRTDGSIAATGTEAWEESAGDCNVNDNRDSGFYSCFVVTSVYPVCESSSSASTFGKPKINPDSIMNYSAQTRGEVSKVHGNEVAPGAPICAGLDREICAEQFGGYWSDSLVGFPTSNPTLGGDATRGTLGFAQPSFTTFYAHVGAGSGTTPGGHGTYGATQCPLHAPGSPITNGWQCDPTKWYALDDGSGIRPDSKFFPHAVVGQAYELRDIDCVDGQIAAGVPVFLGAGQQNSCDDVPSP